PLPPIRLRRTRRLQRRRLYLRRKTARKALMRGRDLLRANRLIDQRMTDAADWRYGASIQVEQHHFVLPSVQPHSWQIQGTLRTDSPVAAERVAVHPYLTFGVCTHIEE